MFPLQRFACLLGLALPVGAAAQTAPRRPPDCSAPEHRQFDFWIGDWVVEAPNGQQAGTNNVTLIQGRCVLQEHWVGAQGGTGESYNIYNRQTGRWHQTWVASNGNLLLLDGGLVNNAMVLQGETVGANGARVLNRVTWTPLDGGRVRQLWETSRDGGTTWATVFDGMYRRRS